MVLRILVLTGLFSVQFVSAQSWYDSNWRFRAPVTVPNPGSTLLEDFQVKVILSPANFDFSKA